MKAGGQTSGVTAILTLIAMLAFAANSVLARLGLGESAIDPASYTAVRLLSGAATLWAVARFSSQDKTAASPGSWPSGAMLFLYAITFSFAYITLSTGTGALILFAAVQITMIAMGLYSGERPRPLEWLGLLIAIIGLIYLLSPGITAPSLLGSFLMLLAGIAWGVYSIRGRGAVNPMGATADNFMRTVPFALIMLFIFYSKIKISQPGFFYALISGAISSGVGYAIWYAALRGLTATRAATVQLSVPVLAAVGGVIFLSEAITPRLAIASVAILSGIGMAVLGHQQVVNAASIETDAPERRA
ncbi:MAG: DMT family transporter [Deltaproteobacteria bacterium]|nr:DMT family transporter [Deltaproteobacteria bacterium]